MATSSPMFGVIVPGRLVSFEYQAVSESQLIYPLADYDSINHVCIFMTGSAPLPPGYSAAVYLHIPKPQPSWYLLGSMGNEKPSVIYKFAKPKTDNMHNSMFQGWQANSNCGENNAQIGISIEPTIEVTQKTPSGNSNLSTVTNFVEFAQKMLTNAFNFCSSFAINQSQMTPQPHESFVPLSALQKWYGNFERKLKMDPNFWKDL